MELETRLLFPAACADGDLGAKSKMADNVIPVVEK